MSQDKHEGIMKKKDNVVDPLLASFHYPQVGMCDVRSERRMKS
jgi:hypothetical protein